jgi:hypothetical protein
MGLPLMGSLMIDGAGRNSMPPERIDHVPVQLEAD